MIIAYDHQDLKLVPLQPGAPLEQALWIDLCLPTAEEIALVERFSTALPRPEDMKQIEVSNRLYRQDDAIYMTIVIPGEDDRKPHALAPVTFVLTPQRLITIRHHAPRPFDTYALRAHWLEFDLSQPLNILLGLIDEIIGREADSLEEIGSILDAVSSAIYATNAANQEKLMDRELRRVGQQGERVSQLKQGLITLSRALVFLEQMDPNEISRSEMIHALNTLMHDTNALALHTDFLNQRVGMTNDVIVGLINIAQSHTNKTVSVVAILFMPPTLIASIYGMNFVDMPELAAPYAYPITLAVMVSSALGCFALFRWLRWL